MRIYRQYWSWITIDLDFSSCRLTAKSTRYAPYCVSINPFAAAVKMTFISQVRGGFRRKRRWASSASHKDNIKRRLAFSALFKESDHSYAKILNKLQIRETGGTVTIVFGVKKLININ